MKPDKSVTVRGSNVNLPSIPKVFSAAELEVMKFPEPVWIVPGIIPEGVTLWAGKPKTGKSYGAVNVGLALACGGLAFGKIPVRQRGVLYLSLEDRQRRLQKRIRDALPGGGWPDAFHISTEWPRVDEDGIPKIKQFLESIPDVKLIIIDVLAKFRARSKGNNSNLYETDYAAMEGLMSLANMHDVSILIIHHTRKAPSDDPLDEVSGSTGLSGAVDTVMVLKKDRGI